MTDMCDFSEFDTGRVRFLGFTGSRLPAGDARLPHCGVLGVTDRLRWESNFNISDSSLMGLKVPGR